MSPTRLPTLPAARLAEVGGATIEYIASGTSPPTIVLVNGAGGPLDGWSRVFGPLLRYGMVVAYNRPGIGQSSRPTEPQTGALIVGTLRDLLAAIEAPPPYILLGHSLGGLYVQLFAQRLPEDVCGVVLVEAAHPNDRAMADMQPGWVGALNSVLRIGNPLRKDRAFEETRWVDRTCRQIEQAPPFPDVPLAVVTAARPPPSRQVPEEVADLRAANQEALVALARDSRHFHAAGSSHFPQLSEPAVIVDGVRWIIERLPHRRNRDETATDHASTGFWSVMDPLTTSMVTFETALGRCAVRWSDAGITGVLLPKAGGRPRPLLEEGAAVPRFVAEAIEGIVAVMAGESRDLRSLPLDERDIDDFRRAVYAATRDIPAGTTRSYGEVARAIGRPDGARDVGAALARNPFPIIVPCHRVVAANGALTGFSAPGGLETKRRMLELEGAPGYGQQVLFG